MRARSIGLTAIGIAVATISGCGGGESPTTTAAFAPADVAYYVEVRLRPTGAEEDQALAAMRRLGDVRDPIDALERATSDGVGLTEARQWLGGTGAIFGDSAHPTIVFETTDPDAALADLRREMEEDAPVTEREVAGTTMLVGEGDGESEGAAAVGSYVIGGTETGVSEAIEAADGESLADTDLDEGVAAMGNGALAYGFARLSEVTNLADDAEAPEEDVERALLGHLYEEPVFAALRTDGESLTFDLSAGGLEPTPLVTSDALTTRTLYQQPADSAGAIVMPRVNAFMSRAIRAGGSSPLLSLAGPFLFGQRLDVGGFLRGAGRGPVEGAVTYPLRPATARQGALLGQAFGDITEGRQVQPFSFGRARGYVTTIEPIRVPVVYLQSPRELVVAFGANAAKAAVSGPRLRAAQDFRRIIRAQPRSFEPLAFARVPQFVREMVRLNPENEQASPRELAVLRSTPLLLAGNVGSSRGTLTRVVVKLR